MLECAFDQNLTIFFNFVNHVGRQVFQMITLGVARVVPDPGFPGEQVNDADKIIFFANRQCHDQRVRAQNLFNLIRDTIKVSTEAIHLVDEDNSCNLRVVRITPVGFRLGLNAAGATKNTNSTIKHL